jgi:hypothetical protein
MYRIHKTLPWAGAACALAMTMACSNGPDSPAAPAAAVPSTAEAAADGSTLKATAPTPISPVNDERLDSRRPTMRINNSEGRFAGATFRYEFQVLSDGGSVVGSQTVDGGNGTTTAGYPNDLERDTPYRWQARAIMGSAVGPWSTPARFLTVKENRTPNPTSGRLPLPGYGASVVNEIASRHPDYLRNSCQEHGGTWQFMDALVDELRLRDTRWGYNGKRGNPNDPSLDVVAYNWGSQPDEGTTQVYIIDVILQHCGDAPIPAWIDQTQATADSNTIGRWTSRGRFAGSSGIE